MKRSFALCAITTALFTFQASAEVTPTTTATSTTKAPSVRDNISATFASFLYGPAVGNITSSLQPGANGKPGRKQVIENSIIGSYKLNPLTSVSLYANYAHVPVVGQELILRDPALRVSRAKIVDANNISLSGAARIYIPVSPASRERKSLGVFRLDSSLGYQPTGSRWSAGHIGDYRLRLRGGDTTYAMVTTWNFIYADYKFNSKTSFCFGPELSGDLNKEVLTLDPAKISAGLSYQVLPMLNINPIVSVPATDLSLGATQLFLGVTAKLL